MANDNKISVDEDQRMNKMKCNLIKTHLLFLNHISIFTNNISNLNRMATEKNATATTINNITLSKKNKFKRTLLIILAVLLILTIPAYIFWDFLFFEYYNVRNNRAQINDKLYPAEWMAKSDYKFHLSLYRTAEPINSAGKKLVVDGGWEINSDSLAKHHSNFVGYYKGYKIMDNDFGNKMLYYIFIPNKLGLVRINYESEIELPKGYKFTNEPFYVVCYEISTNGVPKPTIAK